MNGYGYAVFTVGFFAALSALIWLLTYLEQTLLEPATRPRPDSDGNAPANQPENLSARQP